MQTKTLVQASANIITITSLVEGDVYKRLIKRDYEKDYKLFMGVVTGVMHNGEEAAITAIEFEDSYSAVNLKLQVFAGDTEVAIYHATPDEITAHMSTLAEIARKNISRKEEELAEANVTLTRISHVIDTASAGGLTVPKHTKAVEA